MNGLWWMQTILTFTEIAGVFWGVRYILKEKVRANRMWFWVICLGVLVGLTVYQRMCLMYSRGWLIITLLFCIIINRVYQKERITIWIFQVLYFETLYCLDLFLYIFLKLLYGEKSFLIDQYAIRPMRIIIFLIIRGTVTAGLVWLYKNRGKVVQCLRNGKLMCGIVAILEHFSLIICDSIFIPGMESRSIDGWKVMLLFYPFMFIIVAFFFTLQRYRLANKQVGIQNELYAERFQTMEKEHKAKERIYHDFRNHLVILQRMISDGGICQAQEYMGKLLEIGAKGKEKNRTGVSTLDYLIQVKMSKAVEYNIEVREQYGEKFRKPGRGNKCSVRGNG